jgi:hypothetical protein
VIRVYDAAGNVIETHEHKGDFNEALALPQETKSRHEVKARRPIASAFDSPLFLRRVALYILKIT